MASPRVDVAGRQIAGLLTYNPGPGIYSRLERAVQQMPESVRVQELPGLLKRYKDGVPGWELRATDLDSVIAGRDVVPRDELLAAVKERSPVYTHKEIVLGGAPPTRFEPEYYVGETPSLAGETVPVYQRNASPIGHGRSHGEPRYQSYGQGGEDYGEILLLQPGVEMAEFGNHWTGFPARITGPRAAVAHARFDTHGDALRINELQSDLGIHNRKMRERSQRTDIPVPEGGSIWSFDAGELPFPLEDAWAELLIKRLALEAAQKGHRAIEVASPQAVFDKTGNPLDGAASLAKMRHFYGDVVPGALERLGRKMGGLTPDSTPAAGVPEYDVWKESEDLLKEYRRFHGGDPRIIDALDDILDAGDQPSVRRDAAQAMYAIFDDGDPGYATARTREAIALADQTNAARAVRQRLRSSGVGPPKVRTPDPGRRYIMSDEMRRRLIQEGVGAAVAAGVLSQDDLIERLGQ